MYIIYLNTRVFKHTEVYNRLKYIYIYKYTYRYINFI